MEVGLSKNTMALTISVIIRTYTEDRWDFLVGSIGSVLAQTLPPHEVIIVVDHNPALAQRVRQQWPCPKVVVVENARSRGSSGTWNAGIHAATGDVIAFIDDDAEAEPSWLAELTAPYTRADVIGVGGQITPVWLAGKPDWFPEEFYWVVGCSYKGLPEDLTPVRNLIGCNMSFRRRYLLESGGLREGDGLGHVGGQPVGCDETELCIRMRQRWPEIVMLHNPRAVVFHKVPGKRATWQYFRARCNFEGQSKAIVAQLVGTNDGLSSERSYTFKTLPRGVLRGVSDALFRRDRSGLARAGAITGGLLTTALSYTRRKIALRLKARQAPVDSTPNPGPAQPPFLPIRLMEVELSEPLPPIEAAHDINGQPYQRARVLVRLHTLPLGTLDLSLGDDGTLSADAYVTAIWDDLKDTINTHLAADGLAPATTLTPAGLIPEREPRCAAERRQMLENDPPLITIIIPTRNRPQQLAVSLERLKKQSYPNREIIIVDNAPANEDTADLIARLNLPDVRYVREDQRGVNWARNRGLADARGEIVAFMDDDELADPHWLAELAMGYRVLDNVASVNGFILPAEIETQAQDWFEQFGGHSKGRDFTQRIFNTTTHYNQNPLFPVPPFGAAGNMSFKTEVLRSLGGLDVAMGAGTPASAASETHKFTDLLLDGYTLVMQPSALMRHYHFREYHDLRRQLHNYGIGLSAFYTRLLFQNPGQIFNLVALVPKALSYYFGSTSLLNATKKADYPKELNWYRRKGLLYGPIAYVRSWWYTRQVIRKRSASGK
jgi:glycosyltransferase involved in cell wall biosynthesis